MSRQGLWKPAATSEPPLNKNDQKLINLLQEYFVQKIHRKDEEIFYLKKKEVYQLKYE